MPMPTVFTWYAIALRLLLTVIASGVIGFNRDEHGHTAGLRTNILVGLAACIAMVQANLLINSNGKATDSFVVMDTMRLPLGILSGIGFIGAGAIIKRGESAVGVTTAATIWFVTVMGLCFGGGQIGLGLAAFALCFVVLAVLKRLELSMSREQKGTLKIVVSADGPDQDELADLLKRAGLSLTNPSLCNEKTPAQNRSFGWKLQWKGKPDETNPPRVIQDLATRPDIILLELTR
jgi:putative Mg2+ transporter-C (MgtC) family protein